ncbi:MAG: META domain-containing protein [Chloroflexota bacterium]|nr:MAG: META domain-containing protein [Chloroflexota bacterium]
MKLQKLLFGLAFMTIGGIILTACAGSSGTSATDTSVKQNGREKTVFVGPLLVDCEGEGPQKCMLIKEKIEDEYALFYDKIEGFDYEEGFEYKIVVKEESVENPPAGGSSIKWTLLRIESKESVPVFDTSAEKTIYVGAELVDCVGVSPQKCMLIKENPEDEYTLFYDQIEGFEYEEGYTYKLVVKEEQIENPPADASSIKWSLVRVESKETVYPTSAVDFEAKDWILNSYRDQAGELVKPLANTYTSARFEDGEVIGNAGCNSYFGGYQGDAEYLSVSQLGMTEMFCVSPEGLMDQEMAFLALLGSAASYKVEGNQLFISDESDEIVLVFDISEPKALPGSLWKVVMYNNGKDAVVSVILDTEINAFFGEDGRLTGYAGCNNYSAEYKTDGENLTIGPAISTRMACSEPEGIMDQESAYLAALELVTTYRYENDRLILLDSEGRRIVDYQPARTFELSETIWYLQNYHDGSQGTVPVLENSEITAYFNPDGNLSGSAGCNNYLGTYDLQNGGIEVGLGPLTMMSCDQPEGVMDQESAYLKALESVSSYQIRGDGMVMLDNQDQIILEFKASDLVGYEWTWVEFLENNDTVTRPDNPANYTLEFLPDGTVTLKADCNMANGSYVVSQGQLELEILATTLALCPEGSLSEKYIQLLNDAVAFIRQGDFLYLDIMMDAGSMKFFTQ